MAKSSQIESFFRIPQSLSGFGRALLLGCSLASVIGCTHQMVVQEPGENFAASCGNLDWYEVGRADGVVGAPARKLNEYQIRCAASRNPVDLDVYRNGREAGLIEFCTATGGLDAGRNGITYNAADKICPENTESAFLANYRVGQRIHLLESENAELESRISDLRDLSAPFQVGQSVHQQIDQLRNRRAQNEVEITTLEDHAETN